MPPVFVQHIAAINVSNSAIGATFDQPVAAGDLIVVAFDYEQSVINPMISVTDSLGTVFAAAGPYDGPGLRIYTAYGIAPTAGTETVTVTLARSTAFFELRMHEFANASMTAPFDGAAGGVGASTAVDGATAGPITTTSTNDLLFAMIIDGTVNSGTGFMTLASDYGDVTEAKIAVAPGAYTATGTATSNWLAMVVAFRGR